MAHHSSYCVRNLSLINCFLVKIKIFLTLQQADEKALEEMRRQVQEMEEEARKLKEMQDQVESMSSAVSPENKEDIDSRSVYIGNVRYKHPLRGGSEQLSNRITIHRSIILPLPKNSKYGPHP